MNVTTHKPHDRTRPLDPSSKDGRFHRLALLLASYQLTHLYADIKAEGGTGELTHIEFQNEKARFQVDLQPLAIRTAIANHVFGFLNEVHPQWLESGDFSGRLETNFILRTTRLVSAEVDDGSRA